MEYDFEELTAEEKSERLKIAIDTLEELYNDNKNTFPYEWYSTGKEALTSAAEWVDTHLVPLEGTNECEDSPYPFPDIPQIAALEKTIKTA